MYVQQLVQVNINETFRITGPLCRESNGGPWIVSTKGQ